MFGLSMWHWLLLVAVPVMTVATGLVASRKNRSVAGWVILGLIFNPVVLIILQFLPNRPPNESPPSSTQ